MNKIKELETELEKCLYKLRVDRLALSIEEEDFFKAAKEYGSELAGNSDSMLRLKSNIVKFEEERNKILLELLNEINSI